MTVDNIKIHDTKFINNEILLILMYLRPMKDVVALEYNLYQD